MFIRRVKNKSGNTEVQVVEKVKGKNQIVKHIGTARNSLELTDLVKRARDYLDEIRIKSGRLSLFDSRFSQSELSILMNRVRFRQVKETLTYRFFEHYYNLMGFGKLKDSCFKDLIIVRIINPLSKAETRNWLEVRMGKRYSLTEIYRCMSRAYEKGYKELAEEILFTFVKAKVSPTISVLFFDVTTLYYEAFDEDDFRKYDFSKDNKASQPQIVVALTVTNQGFPLHLQMFEGNKFEGHTMLPIMRNLAQKHSLSDVVVVADAAMLSKENIEELEVNNFRYIVGARLANLSEKLLTEVMAKLPKVDGEKVRINLKKDRILIVGYSATRAAKDKNDRERQLRRANYALGHPAAVTRNYKFLTKAGENKWELNIKVIKKAEALEGLKGYISNGLDLTDEDIIAKYSELWQIEKSFRISKSDLKARPIFHIVRERIIAHLLIVFIGLAISRYVEVVNQKSLRKIICLLSQVKEIVVTDKVGGETISKFTEAINQDEIKKLLKQVGISWVT